MKLREHGQWKHCAIAGELTKYGLEYLPCDPVVFCPHPDGKYFLAHKSVEKTCAEIARYNTRDAEKYREFVDFWQRLLKGIIPVFNTPPKSVVDIIGNYEFPKLKDLFSVVGSPYKALDLLRTILTSAEDSLHEYFDCALSEAPRFERFNHRDEYLIGSVLIADSIKQVELAHSEPSIGRIPDSDPSMYVVVPTMLDPSMAPEGKHTLWIEFFAPYQIEGKEGTGLYGTGWTDELKNQVADRVIDKLAEYAPNVKNSIIARRVETPAELGERLGAIKGNYYHIDMTLEQMVFFRPLPELANYKTPIAGLFLTGAGTHPGGSISGMPGRNCARVFLHTQRPIAQTLKEAGDSLKSTVESVFKVF